MSLRTAALVLSLAAALPATATELRIASWNLGWHVSTAELPAWLGQCGKSYAKGADGVWQPTAAGSEGAQIGWQIKESRARLAGVDLAVMPPCGVYEAPGRVALAVTPGAWSDRNRRLAAMLDKDVNADVIAFQEVSGTTAVREALGTKSADYEVCSFDGRHKVQRLAFAWRKTLGTGTCSVEEAIALPQQTPLNQVRPGLVLTLKTGEQTLRLLNLHLKSSCVTPLDGRGVLDRNRGVEDPCPILEQQVAPLEAVVEKLAEAGGKFIVLGDFNRNLAHEAGAGVPAKRSDGETDLTKPRAALVSTSNLFREVFDGVPAATRAQLVAITCPLEGALCERAKSEVLPREDYQRLGRAMGCRNAVGLDHFVVSAALAEQVQGAAKIALGDAGESRTPEAGSNDPRLGVSDHCPAVLRLKF
ncbi:MAG TPA: endonuclease/exonuclease/phosphatase family protein [Burkholderiaceae bacterium]